ncbi:hypothetical protein PQ460_12715 [Paenibacillus sp. KACC 21273]|uniref:hypothetical protein n=1 Tax=Paenibacillus sp. KACC 21273 TaxID=3025665 RepID=UPI00236601A8|nr:hypothetical protein [Paenibacillus sp. KACC 21273]WDF48877.1 hypothetical protein PQ460_12715 [Paenibacillus sp. KACC 21273]
MKKYPAYLALLAGMVALSQTTNNPVFAAPTHLSATQMNPSTSASLTALPSISLQSGVSVKLTDIQLASKNTGNILTYTLTYTNTTSSPYKLMNSFSRVSTIRTSPIKGVPVPDNKDQITISPKSTQAITYYVDMKKENKLASSKITMFGWDFNAANYEKKLGTFTVPTNYSPAIAQGKSKKVTIGTTTLTFKPQQLQMIRFNNKLYARLAVQVSNLSTEVLEAPNYHTYLQSATGSSFELQLDHASRDFSISPGDTQSIKYIAAIPASLNATNMTLQITSNTVATDSKTDSSTASSVTNLELPVIAFKLPKVSPSSLTVPVASSRKIAVDGTMIETQLKTATISTSGDKAVWTMQFRIKNIGNQTVVLPTYETSIKTSEGYSFPITTKAFTNLALKPLQEKQIQLSAEIPAQLKQQQLQLQLLESSATTPSNTTTNTQVADNTQAKSAIILPTAFYMIPYSQEQNQSAQTEYTFDNNYGNFGVTLESFQRMPWTAEDIVVAKIRLRNAGTSSVNLPLLGGWIKAQNNRISSPVQIIAEQTDTSLDAGQSRVYYVVSHFDADADLSQLKIELYPNVDTANNDSTSPTTNATTSTGNTLDQDNPFLSLQVGQINSTVAKIAPGSSFHIQTIGKKAEIKERRTITYEGTSQKIAYTELEMKSEEKRTSTPARLIAYYKTPNNEYYEATVNQSDKTVGPDGKNLITVWSKLPASINTSGLTLYIGEAINDGKMSTATTTPTGYINAVELGLNKQTPPVVASVSSDMELFPYRFAITSATGSLSEGQESIALNMTYNFSKDNTYNMGTYGHNLVIQWVDPSGQVQEKTMVPGTDLTLGKSIPYSTTLNSNVYKTMKGGRFLINVYDEFEGERILLGTQSYRIDYTANIVNTPSTTSPVDTPTTNPGTPPTTNQPDKPDSTDRNNKNSTTDLSAN